MIKKLIPVLTVLLVLCSFWNASAYDKILAHPKLTEVAIEGSNLVDILNSNLGLVRGVSP